MQISRWVAAYKKLVGRKQRALEIVYLSGETEKESSCHSDVPSARLEFVTAPYRMVRPEGNGHPRFDSLRAYLLDEDGNRVKLIDERTLSISI